VAVTIPIMLAAVAATLVWSAATFPLVHASVGAVPQGNGGRHDGRARGRLVSRRQTHRHELV
jgi:hypothetical protein